MNVREGIRRQRGPREERRRTNPGMADSTEEIDVIKDIVKGRTGNTRFSLLCRSIQAYN